MARFCDSSQKRGVTLVELIVVLVILAVLAALFGPVPDRLYRQSR